MDVHAQSFVKHEIHQKHSLKENGNDQKISVKPNYINKQLNHIKLIEYFISVNLRIGRSKQKKICINAEVNILMVECNNVAIK